MKYGFIGITRSAKELMEYVCLFEERGVILDNIAINRDFDGFAAALSSNDRVIVISYSDIFGSINSYLGTVIELWDRGVMIESLSEPMITVSDENYQYIRQLYALSSKLRATTSIKGINRARAEGKKLGRPPGSTSRSKSLVAQVDRLCKQSHISITKACKMVGCQQRTYYRLKKTETLSPAYSKEPV